MDTEVADMLSEALLCSVFVSPNNPGLTYEELKEVARRLGRREGETNDALKNVMNNHAGGRWMPEEYVFRHGLSFPEEPDLRNLRAFDYVVKEMNERILDDGVQQAQLNRSVIVERAVGEGFDRTEVEAAITYMVLGETFIETEGNLRPRRREGIMALPGEQIGRMNRRSEAPTHPHRAKILPVVKDIIARRDDGRQRHADPLDAFPDALEQLGYKNFRLWWTQTVGEMRRSEPSSAPVACLVLSAALVEGALTFVVKYARDTERGPFQSPDFRGEPHRWKIDDLIKSAATGSEAAILSQHLRTKAEMLTKTRQRIHAGRMLTDYPGGPPDLRPEEARDAKGTAEQVARAVLDWLAKYPPA